MRITTVLKAAIAPAIIAGGLLATTTGAFASTTTGPTSNGQAGHLTGNNSSVYTDPVFGPVSCNETQHPAFDTISCHAVVLNTADGTVVKGAAPPPLLVAPNATGQVGWNSDFGSSALAKNNQPGLRTNQGILTYTVSPDGMSYTGQVTYNS